MKTRCRKRSQSVPEKSLGAVTEAILRNLLPDAKRIPQYRYTKVTIHQMPQLWP
jgi:hypothetical protein